MDQSSALTNWERQMAQRRKQQGNLASTWEISFFNSVKMSFTHVKNLRTCQQDVFATGL
jgi:hypothetical protein